MEGIALVKEIEVHLVQNEITPGRKFLRCFSRNALRENVDGDISRQIIGEVADHLALFWPTVSWVAPIWRLIFVQSKVSGSATLICLTPKRASRTASAPPMPPHPATPARTSCRCFCSSSLSPSQHRLRSTRVQYLPVSRPSNRTICTLTIHPSRNYVWSPPPGPSYLPNGSAPTEMPNF